MKLKRPTYITLLILTLLLSQKSQAQEFNCNIKIMADRIQSVDPKVFRTLETSLTNFLNSQKWTQLDLKDHEKLDVSYIITLLEVMDERSTVFKGKLSVSASRPVYNSSYKSPLISYVDNSFSFKYIEFQPIQFNELQISGGDPLIDNLTAQFAFYSYVILGLYMDSYAASGGDTYYNKARNIVNNAPKNSGITGWDGSGSNKDSRYWFIDDLQNPRLKGFHPIWYTLHREVLDQLASPDPARYYLKLNTVVNELSKLYVGNASSKIIEFFLTTKGNEIHDLIASNPNKSDIPGLASQMGRMHIVRYKDYEKLRNENQ